MTSRRDFLRLLPVAATAAITSACKSEYIVKRPPTVERLTTRPFAPSTNIEPGVTPLGLRGEFGRDGIIYVPAGYSPTRSAPLLVMFHGGGGRSSSEFNIPAWLSLLDEFDAIMLAPDSRDPRGWDLILTRQYGPDVAFLDAALAKVFQRCNVQGPRIALGGFSDGATEALGLGLMNGDLFRATAGFSPGYVYAPYKTATPTVFVSHGKADQVLSFDNTKNNIVPAIRGLGVPVEFVEFDGGHSIPVAVARQALTVVLGATG